MHVTILVQIYPYFSCFKVASAITMTKVGINLHWYGYMCRQPHLFHCFFFLLWSLLKFNIAKFTIYLC